MVSLHEDCIWEEYLRSSENFNFVCAWSVNFNVFLRRFHVHYACMYGYGWMGYCYSYYIQ